MTRPIVLLFFVAACTATPSDSSPATTQAPVTTQGPVTTQEPVSTQAPATTQDRLDTGDLGAVESSVVTVDDRTLDVAVASTPEARSRGLRAVDDLGDLDGMLFTWGGNTVTNWFTMKDTLIPLDIAFFDADGDFVDGFTMTPCDTVPCPPYTASGPYAYALEVPAGTLPGVGAGSRLVLTD